MADKNKKKEIPQAPKGYHYIDDVPTLYHDEGDDKMKCTQLIFFNNPVKNQRYKTCYKDDGNGNCYCALGCKGTYRRFKNDNTGVLSHMRRHHSHLCHPEDLEASKKEAEDAKNKKSKEEQIKAVDADNEVINFQAALEVLRECAQPTIGQVFSREAKRKLTKAQTQIKKRISNLFAELCMHRGFPMTTVEDECQRHFVRRLGQLFSNNEIKGEHIFFHSAGTLRDIIEAKLDDEELKMRNDFLYDLKSCRSPFFSLTNDCTTAINNEAYCATTASVIVETSSKLVLREFALDYSPFEPPHTRARAYDQVVSTVRKCVPSLAHLRLNEMIFCGVFDCAKNTPREVFTRPEVGIQYTLKCFGHRCSTAQGKINNKIPELKAATDCLVAIFKIFRLSKMNNDLLASTLISCGKPALCGKKLQDTRWESLTRLYKRGNEIFFAIYKIAEDKDDEDKLIYFPKMKFTDSTARDTFRGNVTLWRETYVDITKYIYPLYEKLSYWTVVLQSGTEVTISLVLYAIADMYAVLYELQALVQRRSAINTERKTQLNKMLGQAEQILNDTFNEDDFALNEIYQIAKFLDPRVCMEIGGTDRSSLLTRRRNKRGVVENCSVDEVVINFFEHSKLCNDLFSSRYEWEPYDERRGRPTAAAAVPPMFQGSKVVKVAATETNYTRSLSVFEAETIKYMKAMTTCVERKDDDGSVSYDYFSMMKTDPLDWWYSNRLEYPYLYEIAKVVLAPPAVVGGVERMHSASKRVFGGDRASLEGGFGGRLSLSYIRARQASPMSARKGFKVYRFGSFICNEIEGDDTENEEGNAEEINVEEAAYDSNDDDESVMEEDDLDDGHEGAGNITTTTIYYYHHHQQHR